MPEVLLPRRGVVLCLAAALLAQAAQAQVEPLGSEYALSGPLAGDQVFPAAAVNASGGYVVWQDTFTDGSGLGISARRLDNTLSPSAWAPFRVNQQAAGNQRHPQVAVLPSGAAAFVWEGGPQQNHILFRALNPNGTFASASDVRLNAFTNGPQSKPAIAAINDGNYVVAWESMHEDGHYRGIYMRIVNAVGQPVTAPVQVNQFTLNNQRNASVAGLADGGFVVVWVSENQDLRDAEPPDTVHIYARLYDSAGNSRGDEFRINSNDGMCANPAVIGRADGGFVAAWSERRPKPASWDVFARTYRADDAPAGAAFQLNVHTYGDQYAPRLAALGNVQLVAWMSLGQDGSWEGVFSRIVADGQPVASEVMNNTTTANRQMHPAVISDGVDRFLVLWSSYQDPIGSGFNIHGQRYAATEQIPRPPAPYVSALSSSRLAVTWNPLSGFPIAAYEVYMGDAQPPEATAVVTTNIYTQGGLGAGSTHTFRLAYVMEGGARSLLSEPASASTWSEDENFDGLPDDWQATYWPGSFPGANVDSDGDGASNRAEFMAGTDPTNAESVLKTWITRGSQGRRLNWSTQPGLVYQVQTSDNVGISWSNLGPARFAAGTSDSILIGGDGRGAFYRITRVR